MDLGIISVIDRARRTAQAFLGSTWWQKDLITQNCFQFQLQVIHPFAQVPINSGKISCPFPVNHTLTSLLAAPELSSHPATSVQCSSSYLQPPQFVKQACANLSKSSSQSPADPDPPHGSLSQCLAQ